MIKTTIKTLALGAVSTMALAAPAAAIDERTFRVTQVFPSTHWHMTEGIQKFTDKVKEATDGAIDFEIYHAGQLGNIHPLPAQAIFLAISTRRSPLPRKLCRQS